MSTDHPQAFRLENRLVLAHDAPLQEGFVLVERSAKQRRQASDWTAIQAGRHATRWWVLFLRRAACPRHHTLKASPCDGIFCSAVSRFAFVGTNVSAFGQAHNIMEESAAPQHAASMMNRPPVFPFPCRCAITASSKSKFCLDADGNCAINIDYPLITDR